MIVSHNMDDMARIAERLIVLSHGQIVMDGTPAEIFAQPEKLKGLGLDIPRRRKLLSHFKKRGFLFREPSLRMNS